MKSPDIYKCDNCDKELYHDHMGSSGTCRLSLVNFYPPMSPDDDSPVFYSVMLGPILKSNMNFCGKKCLKEWVNK